MKDHHLGIASVSWEELREFLLLPPETRILGIHVNPTEEKIELKVEHPNLPKWDGKGCITNVRIHHRIRIESVEKMEFEGWGTT